VDTGSRMIRAVVSAIDGAGFRAGQCVDRDLLGDRSGDHNRLGLMVQAATVRYIGVFLKDPVDVPWPVVEFVAEQLGIEDSSCVPRYTTREMTAYEHAWEIRKARQVSNNDRLASLPRLERASRMLALVNRELFAALDAAAGSGGGVDVAVMWAAIERIASRAKVAGAAATVTVTDCRPDAPQSRSSIALTTAWIILDPGPGPGHCPPGLLSLVLRAPCLLAGPVAATGHRHPGLGEPAEHGVGSAVVQFGHLGGGTAGAVLGRDLGQEVLPGRGP